MTIEKIPITREEIAALRDEIQIGDAIDIGHREKEEERGNGTLKKYRGKVVEKYRHLVLCEYFRCVHRLLETVLYVQIIQGDGVWLV